jgi:hypothetical protein
MIDDTLGWIGAVRGQSTFLGLLTSTGILGIDGLEQSLSSLGCLFLRLSNFSA